MAAAAQAAATADGDRTFVICAVGETKTVSWSDVAGTPPGDDAPASPGGGGTAHCDACLAAHRVKAAALSLFFFLPGVDLHRVDVIEPDETVPADLHVSGPPLPSRAPPLKAAQA